MPTPGPIGVGSVRRVCVQNSGAFALHWQIIINPDSSDPMMGEQSDTFDVGSTECIDGTDVLAKYGDYLGGKVYIMSRSSPIELGKPYQQYNVQSKYQANYKCTGDAITPVCKYNGVTAIGAEGSGGRRRRSSPVLEKLRR